MNNTNKYKLTKNRNNCLSRAISSLREVECFLNTITKVSKVTKICNLLRK